MAKKDLELFPWVHTNSKLSGALPSLSFAMKKYGGQTTGAG